MDGRPQDPPETTSQDLDKGWAEKRVLGPAGRNQIPQGGRPALRDILTFTLQGKDMGDLQTGSSQRDGKNPACRILSTI